MTDVSLTDDELQALFDEGEQAERNIIESQVTIPDEAGSFIDMVGPAIGGNTPAQTKYIRDLIKQEQAKDPNAFLRKYGKVDFFTNEFISDPSLSPAGEAEARVLRSLTSLGGIFSDPTDVIPGFDRQKYNELADSKSQTALAADQRRFYLSRAGQNGEIGARITNMYDNGLDETLTFKLLQTQNDDEVNDILQENFGREARLLSPVQVGINAEGKPIYEKIYQKEEGGQVYRLEIYDDFTDLRTFMLDTLRAARGDEEAQSRLAEVFENSAAGAVENLASPEVVLPMLAYAIPGLGQVGLGVQFLTFLGRGLLAGGLQAGGQQASRAFAGLDTSFDDINKIDALIEAGIASFGPPAFRQLKKLFGKGDGVLESALLRAAGAKAPQQLLGDVARDLGEETAVSLPLAAILAKDNIGKGFSKGILGFFPERAKGVVESTGEKIHDVIVNRILQLRSGSKLSQNDLVQLANSYRIDFTENAKLLNDALLGGKSMNSASVEAARAARANLQGVFDSMRNNAGALYNVALRSAKSKDAKLEGEIADIIAGRLERLQTLAKQLQNPRTIGQEAPKVLDKTPDDLSQFADLIQGIDSLAKASKSPITGERTSVLDQIHGLKQRLDQESLAGGPVEQIKAMRETLDEMLKEVGDSISFRDTTAGGYYQLAGALYEKRSSLQSSQYIMDSLRDGNARPLQTLLDPLMTGKATATADNLETLARLIEIDPRLVAEKAGLKPAMTSSARATVGGEELSLQQIKKNFFEQLSISFKANMMASNNMAGDLRKMLGVDDLSSINADNELLRFVLPKKSDRKLVLDTALEQERAERKAQLFSSAIRESLSGRMVSEDVTRIFVETMQREYAKNPGQDVAEFFKDALRRFPDTKVGNEVRSGLERALPQVQAELLNRILLSSKRSKLARGPGGRVLLSVLDMEKVASNIAELQDDDFAREFLNWTFSQGTGLRGVQDIPNLVSTVREIGEILGDVLPGGAESLATAGLAQEPVKAGFSPRAYLYRLLASKKAADFLLNPVSRKRINDIIASDQPVNRKAELLFVYLQSNARNAEDKRERLIAVDDKFYSLKNYRGPEKDRIFKRYDELRRGQSPLDRLRGDAGDDVITGSNVNLPSLQSAPIPFPVTGLGIPAPAAAGGRGIAALPAPETAQQLAQVGLPLFGGTRG